MQNLPDELGIDAELMETILIRRQEDSGQKQLADGILALRALSYAKHMKANGINPNQYDDVYELAVSIYNESEIKGPFGVDFLIQASKRLNEINKKYTVYKKSNKAALISCSTCQGSKLSYKFNGNKIIGLNKNEDGSVKKCEECVNE